MLWSGRSCLRQLDDEPGARAFARGELNAAAMRLDDLPDDVKPESKSADLVRGNQALEPLEDALAICSP